VCFSKRIHQVTASIFNSPIGEFRVAFETALFFWKGFQLRPLLSDSSFVRLHDTAQFLLSGSALHALLACTSMPRNREVCRLKLEERWLLIHDAAARERRCVSPVMSGPAIDRDSISPPILMVRDGHVSAAATLLTDQWADATAHDREQRFLRIRQDKKFLTVALL
jgi:hypothetical protein